jgi:hypothetical protein
MILVNIRQQTQQYGFNNQTRHLICGLNVYFVTVLFRKGYSQLVFGLRWVRLSPITRPAAEKLVLDVALDAGLARMTTTISVICENSFFC